MRILTNPYVIGALSGWATAARVDYAAFKSWHSASDAWAYDWKIATWRWLQGAVIGAVGVGGSTSLLRAWVS